MVSKDKGSKIPVGAVALAQRYSAFATRGVALLKSGDEVGADAMRGTAQAITLHHIAHTPTRPSQDNYGSVGHKSLAEQRQRSREDFRLALEMDGDCEFGSRTDVIATVAREGPRDAKAARDRSTMLRTLADSQRCQTE